MKRFINLDRSESGKMEVSSAHILLLLALLIYQNVDLSE